MDRQTLQKGNQLTQMISDCAREISDIKTVLKRIDVEERGIMISDSGDTIRFDIDGTRCMLDRESTSKFLWDRLKFNEERHLRLEKELLNL